MLNFSAEAKQTHLLSGLYIKDSGEMDSVDSVGFVERKKYLKHGVLELSGYIHSELMSQDKYLVNGVNVRVKFFRSKPEFALLAKATDANKYKIEISDAILLIRKVKINPSIMVAHTRVLNKENIKYCINRVEIKTLTISADTQSKMLDNIFTGEF